MGINSATVEGMWVMLQYGGKITDDLDRRLFRTYANQWLTSATTKPGFAFRPSETLQKIENDFGYGCPPGDSHEDYAAFAKTLQCRLAGSLRAPSECRPRV